MTIVSRMYDGRTVKMTQEQADVLDTLSETRKGGMAVIHGYSPDARNSKYVTRPVYDVTVISRIRIDRLYARAIEALESVEFDQLDFSRYERLSKLSVDKLKELFDERKAFLLGRYRRERENAHTAAHVRNYISGGQGVKGNLVTEPETVDGRKIQVPVTDSNGHYTLKAILIEGLEVNRHVIREGELKPTNPQNKTLVMRQIERLLPRVSVNGYRRFSLSPETFKTVSIDRQTIFDHPELVAS